MNSGLTGVFGGTFNPIHLGHLRAAEEVADRLDLDRVLFVPSARPPHKGDARHDPIAPAEQRLDWVRTAVADNPRFAVEPLEVERGGTSYTVETLRALADRLRPNEPVFVIGCDAFAEIGAWREPETVFSLTHFAVMTRPPAASGRLHDWLPKCLAGAVELDPDGRSGHHRETGKWLRSVEILALDVSSSEIRERLRSGNSVQHLLPDAVRHAVTQSGIYASA
ncbi:MAG: nicotinate-nucleotide adenylyltransferase [Myxococcota bacterium]|nr:nicotinate-nucleotide adenylyltransferase [Myxococcota bacterium]